LVDDLQQAAVKANGDAAAGVLHADGVLPVGLSDQAARAH
jgi:hypothetical protein